MRVINPAIGRRLAAIRRHRMWFLAELADAIGVTKGTITHYEQGRAEIKLSRPAGDVRQDRSARRPDHSALGLWQCLPSTPRKCP